MEQIRENIHRLNCRKEEIALKTGRDAEDILLIAVTKTRTAEEINQAIEAGITDIGENKVQEILDKYDKVKSGVRWHMIGHLQTNKVKYVIDKVDLIHSVDSIKLANEISSRAAGHNRAMDILVQVNAAQEESKFGITAEETGDLLQSILEHCENVRVRGLMSIAPFAEDPEEVRMYFRQVKKLYDEYAVWEHPRLDFKYLSMGMSHDFPVAVEEGSNMIRVGTAIFGERNYK